MPNVKTQDISDKSKIMINSSNSPWNIPVNMWPMTYAIYDFSRHKGPIAKTMT